MTLTVVMGVSGCGKTTIAAGIADHTGWVLLEGDSFHPLANISKMSAGIPLTDEDRWPWLRAIAAKAHELHGQGLSCVVACSALKRSYRDILLEDRDDTILVYLRGSKDLIAGRLAHRHGHFMPPGLLDSQFATLQEPTADEQPIVADVEPPPDVLIDTVVTAIKDRLAKAAT
jgi:gluconokinase